MNSPLCFSPPIIQSMLDGCPGTALELKHFKDNKPALYNMAGSLYEEVVGIFVGLASIGHWNNQYRCKKTDWKGLLLLQA